MTPTRRGYFVLTIALTPLYAVCYSAIKLGLAYAPPIRYGGLRAMVAGTSLLLALRLVRCPVLLPSRLWPGTVVISLSGTVLAFAAMFSSPGRTGAGIASVLGNTTPLAIAVLAAIFLGETVSRMKAMALFIGFVGAALIAYPTLTDPAHHSVLGALLPLTAATGFAISSVLLKRIDAGGAVLQVAGWQLLLGSVPLLVLSVFFEPGVAIEWNATFLGLLLFLGVIGTALTTAVWYWLVQRDDVSRLSIALFLVPVMGLGMAVALFDEGLDLPDFVGVGLILAAIAAITLDGRHRRVA